MNFDDPLSPTTHIMDVFARHAPEAAAAVSPFVPRLLKAEEDGHAFIWLSAAERDTLAAAAPLVGHNGTFPLVLRERRLFWARNWQLERDLAQEIQRLSAPVRDEELPDIADSASRLQHWFADAGASDQQAAAAFALLNRFTLISGGPGTGKTTTIAKLLALLSDGGRVPDIALAAPTGKAAARMSEALRQAVGRIPDLDPAVAEQLHALEGQTLHRLLQLRPPQMRPAYHERHRLSLDVLVADEASMIDNYLFLQMLRALPNRCRVILLGDADQLPPVGAGAVLAVLAAQRAPLSEHMAQRVAQLLPQHPADSLSRFSARLRISHRFDDNSAIGCLARAVAAGDAENAWAQFTRFPDALSQQQGTFAQQAAALYLAHRDYWQAVEAGDAETAFARAADTVVLAARRRDADNLNQAYTEHLRRYGRGNGTWFAGQMLMVTRNDPATALFNGDIGLVLPHQDGLAACFPHAAGRLRYLPLNRLPAHETAFAITVHKSQGSEYREVWLLPPQSDQHSGFTRALLYTAITRAKSRFRYWGDPESFARACADNTPRRSALGDYLNSESPD